MPTDFGEELKRLRIAADLSQEKLGEAVGLTQGMIGHIERGLVPGVSAHVLFRLCDALGVQCNHFREFLKDETAPPPLIEKPKRGRPKKT